MGNDVCKQECIEEKHVIIVDSLEKLEEFICRLEELVLRVKSANQEDGADVTSNRGVSLQSFLADMPEDIAKMTARVDRALSELTDLLF